MIDIHSHILPGLDDGPEDEKEAINILRLSQQQEISSIVATPHFLGGYSYDIDLIYKGVECLQQKASTQNINIEIMSGSEIFLDNEILTKINDRRVPTLNGSRYLLLELPISRKPKNTANILHDIKLMGYKPVIAHPERCQDIINNVGILHDWIEDNIYIQMNAGSLLGRYGQEVKEIAGYMLDNGLVHLLASDTHSSGRRGQCLPEAFEKIRNREKGDQMIKLFRKNARRVVGDEKLIAPYSSKKPEGIWTRVKNKLFVI